MNDDPGPPPSKRQCTCTCDICRKVQTRQTLAAMLLPLQPLPPKLPRLDYTQGKTPVNQCPCTDINCRSGHVQRALIEHLMRNSHKGFGLCDIPGDMKAA